MILHSGALARAIVLVGVSVLAACSDARNSLSPNPPVPSGSGRLQAMTSCGASFTVITDETDSLMTPYGIGTSSDTVNVCESWTGSDYDYQVSGAGSSDNVLGFADTVQTVAYQSGYVTGYTQSGAVAADPTNVGTLFDFVVADDPTRQASYDDPYYGVSSHDPSTCLQPPCPVMLRAQAALPAGDIVALRPSGGRSNAAVQDTLFTRHGLSRKGVRALVNTADEITPSLQGYRRFQTVKNGVTTLRSIDPVTQLLMVDQIISPSENMVVTHKWTKVTGGYVMDRSDYVSTETINGKPVTTFGSVRTNNVRIMDPAYPPLSLPIPSH